MMMMQEEYQQCWVQLLLNVCHGDMHGCGEVL
jgi:hypothetical protein